MSQPETSGDPFTVAGAYLLKRYYVGSPGSPFRFWTARGASRFLSKLHAADIGRQERVTNGCAASVWRWNPRTRRLEEVW